MRPLMYSMLCRDPERRLDAATVLKQWHEIRGGLFSLHRGWRLRSRDETALQMMRFEIVFFFRSAMRLVGLWHRYLAHLLTKDF